MRSRTSIACALTALWLALCAPSVGAAEADASTVQVVDIEAALEKLEADPNLAASRKTRSPKWRSTPDEKNDSSALQWIVELFRWIAQASRVFVWVVIALLISVLALYLFRFLRAMPGRAESRADIPPTHVRDLDIRPESLPDDIGAAAWTAWERGDQRAALSLLYRALLSRLVHVYAAPIRSSSTEGECLDLARARLPAPSGEFATRLIDVWQRAVYGGQSAQAPDVRALCEQFASMFAQAQARAAQSAS